MATQTFNVQSMVDALKTMDPQDRKLLVDELQNLGALPQKTTKRAKSSTKRKSAEEKQQIPFNPQVCHARLIKEACHSGTNIPIWKHTDKTIHLGCVDFQCGAKIMQNGLCKDCTESKSRRLCKVNGITPFGLFNEPRPQEPSRTSPTDGKIKKYIWLEDTQDNESYSQYLTDPDQPTKKSSRSQQEQVEVDWDEVIKSDKFGPVKVKQLKQKLQELNLDTSGKKPDLVDRIKSALLPYDQEPQQPQQPQEQPQQPQEQPQQPLENDPIPENNNIQDENLFGSQDTIPPEEDLEEIEEQDKQIFIDSIEYVIRDGVIFDIKTNREMGEEEETDPQDWGTRARKLHKQNIEEAQNDM